MRDTREAFGAGGGTRLHIAHAGARDRQRAVRRLNLPWPHGLDGPVGKADVARVLEDYGGRTKIIVIVHDAGVDGDHLSPHFAQNFRRASCTCASLNRLV